MIYWFTGQPGAGKTTLATALKEVLNQRGLPVVHLDGEELRVLMDNQDYSEQGRLRNIRTAQALAWKLQQEGILVAASLVSPYRAVREDFKRRARVAEVHVHTTALRGREDRFVHSYEPPLSGFVDVDTTHAAVKECVRKILQERPVPYSFHGRPGFRP